MSDTVKEYEADGLFVIWEPKKCIHSEICVKTLPEVYKPDEKPWIQAKNAGKEELISQIDRCPSGALTYRLKGERSSESNAEVKSDSAAIRALEVIEDGPARVPGPVEVEYKGEAKFHKRDVFICRCGASGNKPYCDGSHKKNGFSG